MSSSLHDRSKLALRLVCSVMQVVVVAARTCLRQFGKCVSAFFLLGILYQAPVQAAVLAVTTTDDTVSGSCAGSCSLRDAIRQANLSSDQDTITLPAGTYLFTQAGRDEPSALTGDLDIRQPVIINGADQATTIIDGADLDGVFEILPGIQVSMSDLTVQNGLRNFEASVGGGILSQGDLTLTNVTVTSNQSSSGGGIFNSGQMTLTDVSVTGNDAVIFVGESAESTGFGGGIYNNIGSTLTINDSTVSSNTADRNGGGIFNHVTGQVTVTGTSVLSNNTSLAYGGAISNSGTLSITGTSTFDTNTADDGGAIANLSGGVLFMTGSTLTNNTANGVNLGGGGAVFSFAAEATISDSIFTGNDSYGEGGGAIASMGGLWLSGSTFDSNTAIADPGFSEPATSPGLGGALYVINTSTVIVDDCSISNNRAGSGGGAIYNDFNTDFTINSSELLGNQVTSDGPVLTFFGGGIHTGGTLNFNSSTLINNSFDGGPSVGGGMLIFGGGVTTITNSTISANRAEGGGGISHQSTGTLTVKNTTFSSNHATGVPNFGGGVHSGGNSVFVNTTFSGNTSDIGGAISSNGALAITDLTNVTITGNTATTGGPGIYNWEGKVTLVNTVIADGCNNWHLDSVSGDNTAASPVDNGGNLESPGDTCNFTAPSSQTSIADPMIAALAGGGPAPQSHVPLIGSPLIDLGVAAGCAAVDQNGSVRPFDGDGDLTADCDIGAVEYSATPADTTADLITSYYLTILARIVDAGGLAYWQSEMTRLTGLGLDGKEGFITLAKLFFNSAEYLGFGKNNDDFVTDLYLTFFRRSPSQPEIDFWANEIVGGVSRNTIMNFFVFSAEFDAYMQARFGPAVARPEHNMVNDFYRGMLSRQGDDSGYNYWLGRLRTAQCSGDAAGIGSIAYEVASLFTTSQEYADRSRDSSGFMEDIYDGIMRRQGDSGGIIYWVNELAMGFQTRDQVLQQFAASSEFQTRVDSVVHAGCIP